MSGHRLFIVRTDKARLCLPERRIRNDQIIEMKHAVAVFSFFFTSELPSFRTSTLEIFNIRVNNLHFFVQAVKGRVPFGEPDKTFLEFDEGNFSSRIFLCEKKSDDA